MQLFALQFLGVSIATYLTCRAQGLFPLGEGTIICWAALTLISFGLAFSMLGLTIMSLFYTAKNVTKIDLLKGTFRTSDPHNLHPNPYHLGVISNFASIFEGNLWNWWLPTTMTGRADALRFPMVPPVAR